MIIVFAFSFYFTLAVLMYEVYCVGYTHLVLVISAPYSLYLMVICISVFCTVFAAPNDCFKPHI